MKKYTVHRHVQRLEGMLQQEAPCMCCPAYKHFDLHKEPIKVASAWNPSFYVHFVVASVCKTCRDFVGLSIHGHGCPCKVLGDKKALKETVAAIAKYHKGRGNR